MLERDAILRLIPHQGRMCLLDRVISWDAEGIVCETSAHRHPDHPLRHRGRLPGVSLIEPGLQAAALHGALIAKAPQLPGLVIGLREVEVRVDDAASLPAPLRVEAMLLATVPGGVRYRFTVGDVVVGEGMIAVPVGDAG